MQSLPPTMSTQLKTQLLASKNIAQRNSRKVLPHVNKEGAADEDWLPDDASAQDILSSVPVYDAQALFALLS